VEEKKGCVKKENKLRNNGIRVRKKGCKAGGEGVKVSPTPVGMGIKNQGGTTPKRGSSKSQNLDSWHKHRRKMSSHSGQGL